MPLSISDHLGLPAGALAATGAFDAILDVDSRLFIDPSLVRSSGVPEFKTAARTLDRRFTDLILLLRRSRAPRDFSWLAAFRLLNLREPAGLCIGYARNSTQGSGIGPRLKTQMLNNAKEIVDAGIDDPRFFELMGILQEGIGADRISDMTARILSDEIGAYSERIFAEVGAKPDVIFRTAGGAYRLPRNPFSGLPILLVPEDVLRPLPVAESWDDIDAVIAFNEELRFRVNQIIGSTWKRARYLPKRALRDRLVKDPELFKSVIEAYASVRGEPYDYRGDPLGEVQWYTAARFFGSRFPLQLVLPSAPAPEDITKVVIEIARHFKQLVEENGLWKLLYNDDGSPKPESAAQLLLYGLADKYCDDANIDISPETDSGRGEVDFKFSRGRRLKTVLETKLTSNGRITHGFETQVEIYAKAERTDQRVYVVIDVEGPGNAARLRAFKEREEELRTTQKRMPVVIHVNARPKPSASVAKAVD